MVKQVTRNYKREKFLLVLFIIIGLLFWGFASLLLSYIPFGFLLASGYLPMTTSSSPYIPIFWAFIFFIPIIFIRHFLSKNKKSSH
jgi:hypothetical protein